MKYKLTIILTTLSVVTTSIVLNAMIVISDYKSLEKKVAHLESVTFGSSRCEK